MVYKIHIQYTRRKTPLDMKEEETRKIQLFPVITEVSTQAKWVHYLVTAEMRIKPIIHRFGANTAHGHWSSWRPWKVWIGRNQFAENTRQWVWCKVYLATSS